MRFAYRLVFLDVDSTLVDFEGIDSLAEGNREVEELTRSAMNGEVPLDEVYGRRLEIIKPTLRQVEALGEEYVERLIPGARETIQRLQEDHVDVHLLTAGIEQAVLHLGRSLALPDRAVHAVRLLFDSNGEYVDYDRKSPLARTGGKELVVRDLRVRSKAKVAMVGDGVSDLETIRVVDRFIGFGGVAVRPRVREAAEIFVEELDFAAVLPYLESADE
jgi:phosphoserine phosphatase